MGLALLGLVGEALIEGGDWLRSGHSWVLGQWRFYRIPLRKSCFVDCWWYWAGTSSQPDSLLWSIGQILVVLASVRWV